MFTEVLVSNILRPSRALKNEGVGCRAAWAGILYICVSQNGRVLWVAIHSLGTHKSVGLGREMRAGQNTCNWTDWIIAIFNWRFTAANLHEQTS